MMSMPNTTRDSVLDNSSKKLLIIDDDPVSRDLIEYYLTGVVDEFAHASSGIEGIRIAEEFVPDVIVLDISMPRMDGFEVCKRLKESAITRDILILFLTMRDDSVQIAKGLDCGASDYLTKPCVRVELQARVRMALRTKQMSDSLRERASIDGLTNLANRNAFDDALRAAIADYTRNGHPFGLLLMDLDHFKKVNDSHGHGVGDETLTYVGDVLQRTCRGYDVAARYGGDEFALLLNRTSKIEAERVGQRLVDEVRKISLETSEHLVRITASVGLKCSPDEPGEIDAKMYFKAADDALYKAKSLGRDRLVEWSSAQPLGCPGQNEPNQGPMSYDTGCPS
jgi:diguanylate cyclase (GGDEF)-like protein